MTQVKIAKDRADWLLDAVATATQDRRFLRGEPEYDDWAGEAILLNGEKAILVAFARAGFATIPDPEAFMDAARGMREALVKAGDFIQPFNRADELLAEVDAALAAFDATLGEQ